MIVRDEDVRVELLCLHDQNGGLSPSVVVRAARDEASCLHRFFLWEDSLAAEKYRLWQARQLIKHVVVSVDSVGGGFERVFFTTEVAGERRYFRREVLVSAPDLLESALCCAREKLVLAEGSLAELVVLAKEAGSVREKDFNSARDAVRGAIKLVDVSG